MPIRDDLAIVVLHGSVSQEGPPQESWAAMPVVATDGGDRVEPFVLLGEPTVDPPENSDVDPEPYVTVDAPDGLELYVGWDTVDDVRAIEGGFQWTETLEPGLHAFIVVLRDPDAGVMARTFLYGV